MKQCLRPATKKITSATEKWADHNISCCVGCYNNCKYCYAKKYAIRFGWATEETWKDMKVSDGLMAKPLDKMHGRAVFPAYHDIIDSSHISWACFRTLGQLLESGNEVVVTTKPRFNIIYGIDERFSRHKQNIEFRFTITSISDEVLRFWEPNAPPFEERLGSLMFAFKKGYRTSVSVEPFLDYRPEILVHLAMDYCTECVWIGGMHSIQRECVGAVEAPFYEDVRRNYELSNLKEIYDNLKGHPKVRFKDSILNKLNLLSEGHYPKEFQSRAKSTGNKTKKRRYRNGLLQQHLE